jgi:putative flippase GtrA
MNLPAVLRRATKARQFAIFCVVGTCGFVIDASILMLLVQVCHWSAPSARILSFIVAMTFTWALNRMVTFQTKHPASAWEWTRYAALMCVGAVINYSVFVGFYTFAVDLRPHPWIAVAAGSVAAMLVNYLSMRALFTSPPAH